mmetsp:Transcript_13354/g.47156  ORF Transcript_13354/g.47156 Transcript_13354/m.47156 type:complete len:216 (-) Transcript_13354:141-788(-)
MGRFVPGVGGLQGRDLLQVLVGGLAHQLLEVVDALRERGVVSGLLADVLQVLQVLILLLLQSPQLGALFLGGVAQQLLEVLDAVVSVVQPAEALLKMLQVDFLGGFQGILLRIVAAGRVHDEPLDDADALSEAIRHFFVGQPDALLDVDLRSFQPDHLLAQGAQVADECGGLLANELHLRLAQFLLPRIQTPHLPVPLFQAQARLGSLAWRVCGA